MSEFNCITIDTNIFEKEGFNLEDGILANLKQFSRTKTISFVMSDIVLEEIKRHMIAKTDKANKTYCKTLGDLCFYKINEEFSREKIKELKALNVVPIVEARIDKFKKTSNFQNLNIKEVDVNVLIKRYFEGKAPFSLAEKKKYEFPDAIALISMENWARKNKKKMLVISEDLDWKRFCDESEYMKCVRELDEALTILHKDNTLMKDFVCDLFDKDKKDEYEEFWTELEQKIINQVDQLDLEIEVTSAFHSDEEEASIEYNDIDYKYDKSGNIIFDILDINNNSVTLSLPIQYSLNVYAIYSFYLRDEADHIDMGGTEINSETNFDTKIILELEYNKENPENSKIQKIKLVNDKVFLNYGHIEPDYDRDEEWEQDEICMSDNF